ncbi:MAG: YegS/Rv2252/BmrU family lipid kinase [Oscillospiraceae bacterium]|nr:YegS/Rv2252/BmrU family lipid kinase [Oscillospiraceae bacterium]
MKKMLFVINPNAGTRKANKVLTEILTVFSRGGYDVSVYVTAGPGDGKTVVAQRAKDVDIVVCCGGDGTFNETVAGVLESGAETLLGYIPAGSTNDFANSLGLSTDPVEAAKRIADGTPTAYDIGSFGGRYFTYVASFGAFTKTSYTTPQNIKNALGHTAYVLGGIQELSQIRSIHGAFTVGDETVEDDFLFGAICNSTSLGGILTLDPRQVDMSDGMFELLLVRAPKDLAEIAECIQAVQKQVYNCKMITFRSASHIRVDMGPGIPWTLDGEREEGHGQVAVENIHHAIKLVK